MRAEGIKFVGVKVRDTNDVYMTTLDKFFDRSAAKILNYEARGGALQRYLPFQHFKLQPGRVRV